MGFEPNHWYWWIFSALLFLLELLLPGVFFLWSGIAAAEVGLLVLIVPKIGFAYQLFIFSIVSVFNVVIWRLYLTKYPIRTDQPFLNRRGAEYIGRTFTLTEAIINGRGILRVGGSFWHVEGADSPAGTQVRIIGIEGVCFKVEPLVPKAESDDY